MKQILLSAAVLVLAGSAALYYLNFFQRGNEVNTVAGKSFYDLKIKSLDGKTVYHFKDFKGKKVLCVNTASKCGYTPQYAGLQKLQERYKDQLIIIGFPCNQFLGQEPGSASEISEFCAKNYGVTFRMTEKIDVKGKDQNPVYQWLCQKVNNGVEDVTVGWNFGKFLIDEKGNYVAYFPSKVDPLSAEITSKL
ncbi:MAG: glutathione peroxidase [Sphingobacteriaceae bacterium]